MQNKTIESSINRYESMAIVYRDDLAIFHDARVNFGWAEQNLEVQTREFTALYLEDNDGELPGKNEGERKALRESYLLLKLKDAQEKIVEMSDVLRTAEDNMEISRLSMRVAENIVSSYVRVYEVEGLVLTEESTKSE